MTTTIWRCLWSLEEDRPEIDFTDPHNAENDWLLMGEVQEGKRPLIEYPGADIIVDAMDATAWHCYMDGGLGGLFSQDFIEAVGDEALEYFTLLPASLNGSTYYFLRCEKVVDCFDRTNAKFDTFRGKTRIRKIQHYSFFPDKLPRGKLFKIPDHDSNLLFATDDIRQRVEKAQLQGVELLKLP